MTTYHHTAVANADPRKNDAAIWNDPLGALDAAIGNLGSYATVAAWLTSLSVVAGGGVSLLNGAKSAGATTLTVDDGTEFASGIYVGYVRSDGVYEERLVTVLGNDLTVTAIGGDIADNTPVFVVSETVRQAASSITRGGRYTTATLAQALEWAGRDVINPRAFGAILDGLSHTVQDWISDGVFANIAAVRTAYPRASATRNRQTGSEIQTTDEIDYVALQEALTTATNFVVLTYTGLSGTFSNGETVTGGSSGATGVLYGQGTGTMLLRSVSGTFQAAETVTGGTSAATATASTVSAGDGKGAVLLPRSTAMVNQKLVMDQDGMMRGTGRGTIIKNNGSTATIEFGTSAAAAAVEVTIGDLTFQNQAGAGHIVSCTGKGALNSLLDSVFFDQDATGSRCIHVDISGLGAAYQNVWHRDCIFDITKAHTVSAIFMKAEASRFNGTVFDGGEIHAYGAQVKNIEVECTGTQQWIYQMAFRDLVVEQPTGGVLTLKSVFGARIENVTIYDTFAVTTTTTGSVSGVTVANPGVVTSTSHGLSNGDRVTFSGVAGMTQLNGTYHVVANVTADTFEIGNTSLYSAYTSGGTWTKLQNTTDHMFTLDATSGGLACRYTEFINVKRIDTQNPLGSGKYDIQLSDASNTYIDLYVGTQGAGVNHNINNKQVILARKGLSTDVTYTNLNATNSTTVEFNKVTTPTLAGNVTGNLTGSIVTRLTTTGTAPTIAALGAAGSGATSSISANGRDTAGQANVTTGTGATNGLIATVTFNQAYATAPFVNITAQGANAGGLNFAVSNTTTTSFQINIVSGIADATAYSFIYHTIGGA